MIRAMDAVDESISAGMKSMFARALFVGFILLSYFVIIISIISALGRDSGYTWGEVFWP